MLSLYHYHSRIPVSLCVYYISKSTLHGMPHIDMQNYLTSSISCGFGRRALGVRLEPVFWRNVILHSVFTHYSFWQLLCIVLRRVLEESFSFTVPHTSSAVYSIWNLDHMEIESALSQTNCIHWMSACIVRCILHFHIRSSFLHFPSHSRYISSKFIQSIHIRDSREFAIPILLSQLQHHHHHRSQHFLSSPTSPPNSVSKSYVCTYFLSDFLFLSLIAQKSLYSVRRYHCTLSRPLIISQVLYRESEQWPAASFHISAFSFMSCTYISPKSLADQRSQLIIIHLPSGNPSSPSLKS